MHFLVLVAELLRPSLYIQMDSRKTPLKHMLKRDWTMFQYLLTPLTSIVKTVEGFFYTSSFKKMVKFHFDDG